jgi:uncharacterized protein YyaL (SSP411 family)
MPRKRGQALLFLTPNKAQLIRYSWSVTFSMHNPQSERKANRLINQKSPYLLQHAYNPVDWYPWSSEAFEKAKTEDKPLFVSIGYSTCHWCHVMEHESFEDPTVAGLMNNAFICIKVDREERPDIDSAYMAVCQAMGRSCGWPLNVILTPEKKPVFVGTYIPKESRFGAVGMIDLVPQILKIWKMQRAELEAIGTQIQEKISAQQQPDASNKLGLEELDEAYDQLFLAFDHENAGFGSQPKFPTPHNLLFLMRYYNRTKQPAAWTMVERTLHALRLGGIFDQVGLGFHRYSTDARWLVPHFEKMLYDQAMLTLAYVEAYQLSGALKFKVTTKEIVEYVLRDLTAPEGVFYSAEDADSEGEEGKFYLWTKKDLQKVLPPDLFDFALTIYDVHEKGNYFESTRSGGDGKNILHIAASLEDIAAKYGLTVDQVIGKMGKTVNLLFEARKSRVRPLRDDKVLVDWNGLMIAALSRAGQVLGEQKFVTSAEKAADFILSQMRTETSKLFHRYAKGERAICGFLDDYAFLVYGLIELYEATFKEKYIQASIELTKTMIDDFWDTQNGGFFFTPQDSEIRPRLKQIYDSALPSGNSVALHNLIRLSRLIGDASFEAYAGKLLQAFAGDVKGYPMGHTFMLAGLDSMIGSSYSVVLVGDLAEKDTQKMVSTLRKIYEPNLTVTLWTPQIQKYGQPDVSYNKIDEKATAYVCRSQACLPPTNQIEKMLEYLTK